MRIVLILLLGLSACQANQDKKALSDLKDVPACRLTQRFNSLSLSCGNNKCEPQFFEDESICPQDCLDPKSHVVPYYAQSQTCSESTQVHSPQNLDELKRIVKEIRGRGRHIRAVGTLHSSNELTCPSQSEIISMTAFNKVIGLEDYRGKQTVHVEGNVRFWDLVNYLDERGYALDQRIPGYGGISVGGFIATGAHGSDTRRSATISSSIISLEVLNAKGETQVYDQGNTSADEWRLLRAHLGLAGIVTRLRLEVRPRYNMAMKIIAYPDDVIFDGHKKFIDAMQPCSFLFAHYVRGARKVYFTCGVESDEKVTHPMLENALFKPAVGGIFSKLAIGFFQQAACSETGSRLLEHTINTLREQHPWIQWEDDKGRVTHGSAGIGSWQRMMEVIFDPSQPKFSQIDWEVSVPMRNFEAVMRELRRFMEAESVTIPTIGVILRFDRANSDSLLAPSASDDRFQSEEMLVHIEMPVYTPFGFSAAELDAYKRPYREFFLSLIERYDAKPHFGKNDKTLFLSPITHQRLEANIAVFRKALRRFDPEGVFGNDFSRALGLVSSPAN